MKVGIVVAHADDETLGCGGTLSRFITDGCEVRLLILGDGTTSRDGCTDAHLRQRVKGQAAALKTLGIDWVETRALADNAFDTVGMLKLAKVVEAVLGNWRSEIIYTHSAIDLNVDHRLTFQAVLTATRPMPGQTVKELYSFEVPSSTEWAFGQFGQFKPNVFVDITETIEAKIKAIRCYASEMRPFPHPRSEEALRAIARRWGSVCGAEYAEAFQLIRRLC